MMQEFIRRVADFHRLIGAGVGCTFPTAPDEGLVDVGVQMVALAKTMERDQDPRHARAHLTIEETGEWLVALGQGNEPLALDALADRLFVLLGDAVYWDLPIVEAMREVCRSNLSKRKQDGDHRVRDKGPAYSPPDIVGVLARYRAGRDATLPTASLEELRPSDQRLVRDVINMLSWSEGTQRDASKILKVLSDQWQREVALHSWSGMMTARQSHKSG